MLQRSLRALGSVASFEQTGMLEIMEKLPIVEECTEVEVHFLSLESNSPSEGYSDTQCSTNVESNLISKVDSLVVLSDDSGDVGFGKEVVSNGEACSGFIISDDDGRDQPSTPKYVVQSKVNLESLL